MAKIYGETYEVLAGIANDETGERFEAEEIVTLDKPWDVTWLLEIGAIQPASATTTKKTIRKKEVTDGDGENE